MRTLPVPARAIRKLLHEIEASGRGEHVLAVGGASELAPVLQRQFHRGRAEPGAVLLGGPEGADAYVHVLAGTPVEEDLAALRAARRARIPVIAVVVGPARHATAIPYVLATDLVTAVAGESFPLDSIARAIAVRLGEDCAPLAARVPALRKPLFDQLIASFARKNLFVAAAVRDPGVDLPLLALNQLRLTLRLAQASGVGDIRGRAAELAGTLVAGLGLRALARETRARVPAPRWMVNGAVAYAGTLALGEAVRLRLAPASRPRPVAAVPVAP